MNKKIISYVMLGIIVFNNGVLPANYVISEDTLLDMAFSDENIILNSNTMDETEKINAINIIEKNFTETREATKNEKSFNQEENLEIEDEIDAPLNNKEETYPENVLVKDEDLLMENTQDILDKDVEADVEEESQNSKKGEEVLDELVRSSETGRRITDQMDFTWGEINIYKPDELSEAYADRPIVYVVMDRNLGATTSGTECDTGSNVGVCGFLYQFGNNYGFSYGNIDFVEKYTELSVDLTSYGPLNPYYDSRFVRGNNTCSGSCDNKHWAVVRNNNIWGGKDGDYSDRQGPCPDGYHVPTKQEWTDVIDYWTVGKSNQGTGILNNSNINAFRNYFQLPLGGERTRTDGVLSQVGSQGSYFTTEPYNGNPYILRVTKNNGVVNSTTNYNLVNGYSVRCFKNVNFEAYYTVTYNDGVEGEEIFSDQTNSVIFGSNYPEFTGLLEREGYEFSGWTESIGSNVIFDIENNRVIEDITLYAKWIPYYTVTYNDGVEGEEIFSDQTNSVIFGSNYPEFTGLLEREGYEFSGWTELIGSNVIFDIENNRVIEDITLYAKWRLICPDGEDLGPDDQCHTMAEIQRLNQIIQDLELYFLASDQNKIHYTIMDRNMGATEVFNKIYTNVNQASLGYLYQWGNNYGFPALGDLEAQGVVTRTTQVPKEIWSLGVPSNYASGVYYKNSNTHATWMKDSGVTDGIWGGTGDTMDADGENTTLEARQGPCPDGYHVPSTLEWKNMFMDWSGVRVGLTNTGQIVHTFSNDFLIPPAGRRAKDGKQDDAYKNAISYWSSSPDASDGSKAAGIYFKPNDNNGPIQPQQSDGRARARSVRCVKNIVNTSVTAISTQDIYLNGGKNAVISVDNGVISTLGSPTRVDSTFYGWYTTSDFSGSPLSTGDTVQAGSSLYAKFTCNESGYIWNGSECEYWVSLYFDSMGGTEVISQQIKSGTTGVRPEDPTKTGYVFSGWFLTGAIEEFNFEGTIITESTTVYAHWNTGVYTITWSYKDANGEDENETTQVEYGGTPTHDNPGGYTINHKMYTFVNWDPAIVVATENKTYTATYTSECEEQYHADGDLCVSEKIDVCTPVENPKDNADYTTTGAYIWENNQWNAPECELIWCSNGYHADGDLCVSEKIDVCTPVANPKDNADYTSTGAYIWENNQWNAPECELIGCSNGYHADGDLCVSEKIDVCTPVANPKANADYTSTGAYIWENNQWNAPECELIGCSNGYHADGELCVSEKIDVCTSVANPITNGIYATTGSYTWNGTSWEAPTCEFVGCNGDSHLDGNACIENTSNNSSNVGLIKKDNCPNGDFSDSYYDGDCGVSNDDEIGQTHGSSGEDSETKEYYDVYKRAYENGLITKSQIDNKGFEKNLTRIEASKLLSDYAINILGKTGDSTKVNKFIDVPEYLDSLYGNSVSISYSLGIMGINMPNNRFKPFGIVPRSEFITALSRMTYGTTDGTDIYYSTHMNLMKDLGVIKYANPDIVETVGYALLMLKRSSDILK